MATIKEQVLKEFSDAKCIKIKGDMFLVKSEKGNGISKFTEEDAWLDFKSKYCKPIPLPPIITKEEYLKAKEIVDTYIKSNTNYIPTNQDILSNGTIIYNFITGEEDIIVDYKNGRSSITKKGKHFHVSTHVLGGGWKAVCKILK